MQHSCLSAALVCSALTSKYKNKIPKACGKILDVSPNFNKYTVTANGKHKLNISGLVDVF
jgi:hypothetical protein